MRYFDKATHTETHKESATTITATDSRVSEFFKPLPLGHRLVFVNDLPIIEQIPLPTQVEIDARVIAEANTLVIAELKELDRQSIRDIREWIASQATAPQGLKDREAQAILARGRLQ